MNRIRLVALPLRWKWPLAILGASLYASAYTFASTAPFFNVRSLSLTSIDQAIPLIPWTVFIYLSDYCLFLVLLMMLRTAREITETFLSFSLAATFTYVIFLLYPTLYPRNMTAISPYWDPIFAWLWAFDPPTNCFPSLHVSMSVLGALLVKPKRLSLRIALWAWVIGIVISTLTTKQHYAADVIGGLIIALAGQKLGKVVEIADPTSKAEDKIVPAAKDTTAAPPSDRSAGAF